MKDYLTFKKMITPRVVEFLFLLGVGFSVLAGFVYLHFSDRGFFGAIVIVVAGIFFARIICESLIVFFRIYEILLDIRQGYVAEWSVSMPSDVKDKILGPAIDVPARKFTNRAEYEAWKLERFGSVEK